MKDKERIVLLVDADNASTTKTDAILYALPATV